MISFLVRLPRRSGKRQASTVKGRATKMKTAITARPPVRYSPSVSKGILIPKVIKTSKTAISATWLANPSRR